MTDSPFQGHDKVYHELNKDSLERVIDKLEKASKRKENSLIIIDDFMSSLKEIKLRTALEKLISNRRHLRVSVWVITQTYRSVPLTIRKLISALFLFRANNLRELESIREELVPRDRIEFQALYNHVFAPGADLHQFMFLDIENALIYNKFAKITYRDSVPQIDLPRLPREPKTIYNAFKDAGIYDDMLNNMRGEPVLNRSIIPARMTPMLNGRERPTNSNTTPGFMSPRGAVSGGRGDQVFYSRVPPQTTAQGPPTVPDASGVLPPEFRPQPPYGSQTPAPVAPIAQAAPMAPMAPMPPGGTSNVLAMMPRQVRLDTRRFQVNPAVTLAPFIPPSPPSTPLRLFYGPPLPIETALARDRCGWGWRPQRSSGRCVRSTGSVVEQWRPTDVPVRRVVLVALVIISPLYSKFGSYLHVDNPNPITGKVHGVIKTPIKMLLTTLRTSKLTASTFGFITTDSEVIKLDVAEMTAKHEELQQTDTTLKTYPSNSYSCPQRILRGDGSVYALQTPFNLWSDEMWKPKIKRATMNSAEIGSDVFCACIQAVLLTGRCRFELYDSFPRGEPEKKEVELEGEDVALRQKKPRILADEIINVDQEKAYTRAFDPCMTPFLAKPGCCIGKISEVFTLSSNDEMRDMLSQKIEGLLAINTLTVDFTTVFSEKIIEYLLNITPDLNVDYITADKIFEKLTNVYTTKIARSYEVDDRGFYKLQAPAVLKILTFPEARFWLMCGVTFEAHLAMVSIDSVPISWDETSHTKENGIRHYAKAVGIGMSTEPSRI
ncbi:hypothetical protein T492DRAFT_845181 [Pavlovales sp. CCMP2436]|nr:hypothetical protein T492DRAFT_845181 [Pavlovales sp. CCMP2436]